MLGHSLQKQNLHHFSVFRHVNVNEQMNSKTEIFIQNELGILKLKCQFILFWAFYFYSKITLTQTNSTLNFNNLI